MIPRIENLYEKKLVGMQLKMSLTDNKTFELWRSFMPRRKEIEKVIGNELYSMQIYDDISYFINFNPSNVFTKWACVEVSNFNEIPGNMEAVILAGGLYAVFLHKGPASEGAKTFQFIFNTWLPNSEYLLDNRPHFEILGEKYKNESADSEEEIWIPIKLRKTMTLVSN